MNLTKKSPENLAKLTYLVNWMKNQNCMYEEMNSRVNYGNACYHLFRVFHLYVCSLRISKKLNIWVYKM
jgi:hypothetical protein